MLVEREIHAGQPAAQQGARVLGSEVTGALAATRVSLAHDSLDDAQGGGGLARSSRSPRPRLRMASPIAACVHLAALPWAPWASARPARIWARNSAGVAARGVSVKVRPISIPAWSSEPPTAVPPWVSMYTNAGRFSERWIPSLESSEAVE
jgi:hypothetical protein